MALALRGQSLQACHVSQAFCKPGTADKPFWSNKHNTALMSAGVRKTVLDAVHMLYIKGHAPQAAARNLVSLAADATVGELILFMRLRCSQLFSRKPSVKLCGPLEAGMHAQPHK